MFYNGYVVVVWDWIYNLEAHMTTSEKIDLAVWRYGIVSRLLHGNEKIATLDDELVQLASQTFRKPDGTVVSFSKETIRKWLYRYRHGGLSALYDAQRKNLGTHEAVSKIIEKRLFELRGEYPQWTLARILDQLIEESLWDRIMPSRATLYRFARTKNLLKEPHKNIEASARKFACQNFDQLWMRKLLQGKIHIEELKQDLCDKIPGEDIELLYKCVIDKRLLNRNRAIRILSLCKGIPHKIITEFLFVSESSLFHNLRVFQVKGVEPIIANKRKHVLKHEDLKNIEKLFSIIHSPPSAYGFNRTTWKHDSIIQVLRENNIHMGKACVSKIIKKSGLSYRKARLVLTSNDPQYKEKIDNIKTILSGLGPKEKFFSIDEYGPFAVKLQGGRSLVPAGTTKSVPQWQKSKGSIIMTAALELSTNQVTHFYSKNKNTTEMIKLMNLLVEKYSEQECIYFSWDAASWHASKELQNRVDEINSKEFKAIVKSPFVKLAPLPTCAQFLNVIESVFSGMARAIIHNSDYKSIDECKSAIDRYFAERNENFNIHPKRAGNKIWGKERVNPAFSESNNCKDPLYR